MPYDADIEQCTAVDTCPTASPMANDVNTHHGYGNAVDGAFI